MSGFQPLYQRVAVIGLGLIGGSLARAIRENGLAVTVVGADKRGDELALGRELGIIDVAAGSVAEAVAGADLVVLAVPVKATRTVLEERRPGRQHGSYGRRQHQNQLRQRRA